MNITPYELDVAQAHALRNLQLPPDTLNTVLAALGSKSYLTPRIRTKSTLDTSLAAVSALRSRPSIEIQNDFEGLPWIAGETEKTTWATRVKSAANGQLSVDVPTTGERLAREVGIITRPPRVQNSSHIRGGMLSSKSELRTVAELYWVIFGVVCLLIVATITGLIETHTAARVTLGVSLVVAAVQLYKGDLLESLYFATPF